MRWSRPGRGETQSEVDGGRRGSRRLKNARGNTAHTIEVQGCHRHFLAPSRCSPGETHRVTTR